MLKWIVSSSAIILIVLLLRAVCKNRISKRLRYLLWLPVAAKLLLFPVPWVESSISIFNIPNRLESLLEQKTSDGASSTDAQSASTTGTADALSAESTNLGTVGTVAQNNSAVRNPGIWGAIPWGTVLTVLAGLGSCAFFLFWLTSNLKFAGYLRKHRTAENTFAAELPFEQKLPVYSVEKLPSPCLYGRAIYVTPDCLSDEQKLRHVLAHEYSHYRQMDLLWSVFRGICLCAYWWNPLVWIAASLSKRDCELSCDEAAIKLLGDGERIPYGKTLIDLIRVNTEQKSYFSIATTMTDGTRSLKQRIAAISGKSRALISVGVLALLAVTVGFVATATTEADATVPISGTYVMEGTGENVNATYLTLDTEMGIIHFQEDMLTSGYRGVYDYEIEGNLLKAASEDGLTYYTFEIIDKRTLSFVAAESSDVEGWSLSEAPYDGAVFSLYETDSMETETDGTTDDSAASSYPLRKTYEAALICGADGTAETARVEVYAGNDGICDGGEVLIYPESSTNPYGIKAYTVRSGWISLYLVSVDGEDAIFELYYDFRDITGEASYRVYRFTKNNEGNLELVLIDSESFDLDRASTESDFLAWGERMDSYLESAELLLSTLDGKLRVGPGNDYERYNSSLILEKWNEIKEI